MNVTGNVYYTGQNDYKGTIRPVWLSVDERKIAGGVKEAGNILAGTVIPAGTPVQLNSMGGTLEVFEQFEVLQATAGTANETVLLKVGKFGTEPTTGMALVTVADNGTETAAFTLGTVTKIADGVYSAVATTSSVQAVGALVSVEGDSEDFNPTGLTWHDAYIVKNGDVTHWTAAVVTKGQIIYDAIPLIPDFIKSKLNGITFETELA